MIIKNVHSISASVKSISNKLSKNMATGRCQDSESRQTKVKYCTV